MEFSMMLALALRAKKEEDYRDESFGVWDLSGVNLKKEMGATLFGLSEGSNGWSIQSYISPFYLINFLFSKLIQYKSK